MKEVWTHGGGTDIRAKWPACEAWQPKNANLLRFVVVGIYEAHVYLRKGDRYNEEMEWKGGPIETVPDMWVWWDWHEENGWRPLWVPGFRMGTTNKWQAIKPE